MDDTEAVGVPTRQPESSSFCPISTTRLESQLLRVEEEAGDSAALVAPDSPLGRIRIMILSETVGIFICQRAAELV